MAADDIDIDIVAGPAELDALEPLWIALHRHHRTVVPSTAMLVDDDSVSWSRRRALYRGWMATGDALVLVARRGGAPVGYAVAHLQDGPDDTFAVGARYAELYSLSVAPEARGGGVGTALMDTLDERLAELGITDLSIGVMAGNEDALRFYRRRGLVPVELFLRRRSSEFGERVCRAGSADHVVAAVLRHQHGRVHVRDLGDQRLAGRLAGTMKGQMVTTGRSRDMRCHSRSKPSIASWSPPAGSTGKRAYQRPVRPRASAASSRSRHGSAEPSAGWLKSISAITIRSSPSNAATSSPASVSSARSRSPSPGSARWASQPPRRTPSA